MPVETADVQPIRLGEVVRSSIWLIVLGALLGGGLGFAASTRITERTTATSKILLTPLEGNAFYPSARGENLVNLESEAQALRGTRVATAAKERMAAAGNPTELTESELLSRVKVSVPVNTQILEVSFSGRDEETAVAGSQAFAEAFLAVRSANAQSRIDDRTAQLERQINESEQQLTLLEAELALLPPNSARARVVESTIDQLSDTITSLQASRGDVASTPTDPGELVTPAAAEPAGQLTPKRLLPILGLLFGAALGLVIGLIRSRSDDRIREPADVLDMGVTVVGTVAWFDPGNPTNGVDATAVNDDEYRKLRVAVLAMERRRPFTLLVAGAGTNSAAPFTVVDLAASFARAGLDTVVIDATTGETGPSSVLDPQSRIGLAEVLLGDAVLSDALAPVAPKLWSLAPGDAIVAVADLFVGNEMSRLLDAAKDHCDVVVVASGSAQQGTAQSLADMADAVMVETDQDLTTRAELERAARALKLLSCSFLGTVFLGRDARKRDLVFRPHMAVSQRQLPPGPFAQLPAAESADDASDDDAEHLDTDPTEFDHDGTELDAADDSSAGDAAGEPARPARAQPAPPPERTSSARTAPTAKATGRAKGAAQPSATARTKGAPAGRVSARTEDPAPGAT